MSANHKQPTKDALLTRREIETLRLLSLGKSSKAIADEMGVSVKTIDKFRMWAYLKLDIHSIAEAVHITLSVGLIKVRDLPQKDKLLRSLLRHSERPGPLDSGRGVKNASCEAL